MKKNILLLLFVFISCNMRLWSCQTTENTYVLNIMCREPPWTTTTDHVERTGGT